jgi:hypothetical protein
MRAAVAILTATIGTIAIYAGFLLNAAALGSTLGDVLTVPGIGLVGASSLIVRGHSSQRWAKVALVIARYLSLPLFLLGAWMLALAVPSLVSERTGQVHGIYWAALVTAAGLLAVTWPEFLELRRQISKRGQN